MNFRDLRIRSGFPYQEDLARAIGADQTTISMIERGKIQDPRLSTLEALAKAFRMSMEDVAKAIRKTRAA